MRIENGETLFESQQEVEEYVAQLNGQSAAAETRAQQPGGAATPQTASPLQLAAGATVEVGDDVTPPWMRQSVRYLNALSMQREDPELSRALMDQYRAERRAMPAAQLRAEEAETAEILNRSGMNRSQIHRIRHSMAAPPSIERAQSTLTGGAGGALLPKPFLAEVFVIVEQYGVARKLCRSVPMITNEIDLKSISGKPVVGFVDELGSIPASDITFGADEKLICYKTAGITSWSHELDEDQAIALLPITMQLFGEAFSENEDQIVLMADGSSTYKLQTGILNSASNVVTMGSTKTHFSDITADNLNAMIYKLPPSARKGASFMCDSSILQYIQTLKASGSGEYIYKEGVDADKPATIWRFPIVEAHVMPGSDDTAVSTKFVAFGNGIHALFGQRRGIQMDLSSEAVLNDADGAITFNSYQQDGSLLRITQRIGVKIPTVNQARFSVLRTAAA